MVRARHTVLFLLLLFPICLFAAETKPMVPRASCGQIFHHLNIPMDVPRDAEFPLEIGIPPLQQIFTHGFASFPIPAWALAAFGEGGAATKWMEMVPDGAMFHIPFHEDGEWRFMNQNNWSFSWGRDAELDRQLKEVLAPAGRRLAREYLEAAQKAGVPMASNGNIVLVKSFNGVGAGMWHRDNQHTSWDARAVGVLPFGSRLPTLALYDGKAHTAPAGNLVVIGSMTWHKGINSPGQTRGIIAIDTVSN